jgi:glycosyltransferase involved in cell wall biosynthesis
MACELPVVATRACNFPEVSRAAAGWECEATVESLADTLKIALRACASERRQRGQNGRQLVERAYTWPTIIQNLSAACVQHCQS